MITIEEVEGRSSQGVLRPFLCRCDDGKRYFVKGRGAGRSSLIAEFLAGSIGRSLGLPIPPFEIVQVPEVLIHASAVSGIHELGSGLAFASERLPFVQEFGATTYRRVPQVLRQQVLLFDWWIRNQDRSFRGTDGNPNLLWNEDQKSLVVIDHNLAFDETFDASVFWEVHVFADERDAFLDLVFRAEQCTRMETAISAFAAALQQIPEEWRYQDTLQTIECDFDFVKAEAMLLAFRTDAFWNTFKS